MTDIWIPGIDDVAQDREQYKDAQFERKPDGVFLYNGIEVAHTLKCPHCGGHFISRKGSGHKRRFCLKHMAPICDNPYCNARCIDAERDGLQRREL